MPKRYRHADGRYFLALASSEDYRLPFARATDSQKVSTQWLPLVASPCGAEGEKQRMRFEGFQLPRPPAESTHFTDTCKV